MGNNHFSINGQSGIDSIGPFRGRWRLLLQRARPLDAGYDGAHWETGQGSSAGFGLLTGLNIKPG